MTEVTDANAAEDLGQRLQFGNCEWVATPSVAVVGPSSDPVTPAVSATTTSQTISRQRREIRCPSGKISGMPTRASAIGTTKSAPPSTEATTDPGHTGFAAAPAEP